VLEVEHCVLRPAANAEASKVRVVQTVALGRRTAVRASTARCRGEISSAGGAPLGGPHGWGAD
jgi:hypothetical protein